jgi:hypothetical protein
MRFDTIHTIRFEDILATGKFTINGVDIAVPNPEGENGYNSFNEWITVWEKENVTPMEKVSDAALNAFNLEFQNFIPPVELIDIYNKEKGTDLNQTDYFMIPKNPFKELVYSPLDYTTIVG